MIGDIRGEPLDTMAYPQSPGEQMLEGAAEALGGVMRPLAPVGTLLGVAAMGGAFNSAVRHGSKAALWAGKTGQAAWQGARRVAPAAFAAAKGTGKAAWAGANRAGGWAIDPAGLQSFASRGMGMVSGAGIRATLAVAQHPRLAIGAGVGAGLALGAWSGRDSAQPPEEFTNSANGYMARGAAGRNKSQGHP